MSNKSGTSDQIINIPSGGGAQKGIGETFSPDLFTGTGNFSVPISVPPGRNGFQPQLSLVYSTGNGNGPFGLGWNLSVPGVDRKTAKGIPLYQDRDTFVLSGAEDLIPVATGDGFIQYRPRTEGLFALIRHYQIPASGLDYWEVKSKDGLISYYGQRTVENLTAAATIYDPADASKIFSWKLTETIDPYGNRIVYTYERALEVNEWRSWQQLYLRSIRYIDYVDQVGEEQFLAEIALEYSEDREDAFSTYNSGFEMRTTRRCQQINVYTQADQRRRVRTYLLQYTQGAYNLTSLLSAVEVIGYDEQAPPNQAPEERLPPLHFSYTPFEPIGQNFLPIEGSDFPAQSLSDPNTELIDLFGNGLPDIIQTSGLIRYWQNLGNGRFDLPRVMENAPAGLTLSNPNVQFMDVNGEGKADLVVSQPGLSGYFPTRFNAEWDMASFRRFSVAPSFSLFDPEVKLVDLNGDGVTDAIRAGSRLELYFYDPQEGWQAPLLIPRQNDLARFPDVIFSDPRIRFADMSGDGLQDIVMIHDRNVEYWPYMGYGKWGSRISMRNSPHFPQGYNPQRILVGDIAGDGPSDIVYIDNDRITIWINQNGNGFSDPIEILGTPPVSDMDAVRLDDMLGTGVSGILWSANQLSSLRAHYHFLDLTGGLKPYLLYQMNNNMGSITQVAYRPSTTYYNQDASHRDTRWRTPLPFPVQVVAKVEVIDQISKGKLCTEYSYHHGYWDGGEREFRGFGRVEQVDTQSLGDYNALGVQGLREFIGVEKAYYTPALRTKTWFHLGPVGEEHGEWEELDLSHEYWLGDSPKLATFSNKASFLASLPNRRTRRDAIRALRGSILRTELYAQDEHPERGNRPYTVAENEYDLRLEYAQPVGVIPPKGMSGAIFFAQAKASRTSQWERGEDPMTQFSFTTQYDAFGQAREQWAVACPRGWRNLTDNTSGFLATHSQTEYAYSAEEMPYIKDRVAQTRAYEIPVLNSISELQGILQGTQAEPVVNLIGQTLTYYDGAAFTGLPLGQIGDFGVAVRSESLVMTEADLAAAYLNDLGISEIPAYLNPNGPISWSGEYPSDFQQYIENLPGTAGYNFYDGTDAHTRGYFVEAVRVQFDFQVQNNGRGLPLTNRDPLGRDTQIEYDQYQLLPIAVTTPYVLRSSAAYDYRVMQPNLITDPNGNQQGFRFTPLGLVKDIALLGKADRFEGDRGQNGVVVPSTQFEYNFLAYVQSGQPISVLTTTRIYHISDQDVPEPDRRDETIQKIEFSDGFGRLIQTRAQAEEVFFGDVDFANNANLPSDQSQAAGIAEGQRADAQHPRVIVSGWQVYDNKGQVVEKYEPFFDEDWAFQPPGAEKMGQRSRLFYDPRGQVIRTLNPDGSEQRVIYGIPHALDTPGDFSPSPWEAYTYDANDLAPLSTYNEVFLSNRAPAWHHFTPASIEIDPLGRTIRAIERNRVEGGSIEAYITEFDYDIQGNLLHVMDALRPLATNAQGRLAFEYSYDRAKRNLRVNSIDAGLKRSVLDVMGNPLESRDSKGAMVLSSYDDLNRPTQLWARDDAAHAPTLRQYLRYGESMPATAATALNLRGQLTAHYDEAGLSSFAAYDFKGNLLEKTRQVISDAAILAVYQNPLPGQRIQAFQVDWDSEPELASRANALLDPFNYTSSTTYDALNRAKSIQYPEDVEGQRRLLQPRYNRAGGLESITFDGDTYVRHIAYNAKGQRTLVAYGNNTLTRYAYDPLTFRLARLRSERCRQTGEFTYEPDAPNGASRDNLFQDFAYTYDLMGNITRISDRAPGSGIRNSPGGLNALNRDFTYDALYRLITATGREQDANRPIYPWEEAPYVNDPNQTRPYTQHYHYDPMGNMLSLQHTTLASAGFTRTFEHETANNRLRGLRIGNGQNQVFGYTYDDAGNMVQEGLSRHYEWNHSNQLKVFRNQLEGAEASIHAHYLYDAGGMRVKKLVRTQGGQVAVTTYIDEVYEQHRERRSGTVQENNTLHLMDDQARIALLRVGEALGDDPTPRVKYHYGDHLGSSSVVVMGGSGGDTMEVNVEEYFPYGESSLGSFSRKQYRYCGKEKDTESGLFYYGARYCLSNIIKWLSVDPLAEKNYTESTYLFVGGNPFIYIDQDGKEKIVVSGSEKDTDRHKYNFIDPAIKALKSYKEANSNENITWVITSRGYSESDINKFEELSEKIGVGLVMIDKGRDLIRYFNQKSVSDKKLDESSLIPIEVVSEERLSDPITDISIFGHGVIGTLSLGYGYDSTGDTGLDIKNEDIKLFNDKAFLRSDIYLYTCNAATPTIDVDLESSFAGQLSIKTKSRVYGYHGKTDYESMNEEAWYSYYRAERWVYRHEFGFQPFGSKNLPVGGKMNDEVTASILYFFDNRPPSQVMEFIKKTFKMNPP